MKLYYAPNTCSLATVIAATEAGVALTLEKVDIFASPHTLGTGTDYASINPKLYVPLLELDNGVRLSEGAAILQYIADLAPETGLVPPASSFERYRLQEWLNYISAEIHKSFSPWLFHADLGEVAAAGARAKIAMRVAYIETALAGRDYLMGKTFTVADAYLFNILSWSQYTKVSLDAFPTVLTWQARVAARPAVQAALKRHSA